MTFKTLKQIFQMLAVCLVSGTTQASGVPEMELDDHEFYDQYFENFQSQLLVTDYVEDKLDGIRMLEILRGPRHEELKTWLGTSSEVKVMPYDMYQDLELSEFDENVTVVSALDYVNSGDVAVSPVFYEYAVFGDIREEDTEMITRAIENHLSTMTEVLVDYETYIAGDYINTPTTRINLTMTYDEVVVKRRYLIELFREHPDLTLVMDASANEDGVAYLRGYHLPETLRNLKIVNSNNDITSIGDYSLEACPALTRVSFTNLPKLTSIGHDFLIHCKRLKRLNFSNLPQLTSIGMFFLSECYAFTRLDFSDLPQLTTIGPGFLYCCIGLTWLNFSNLPQLTSIRYDFLKDCIGLTELNFTDFPQLKSIGWSFLGYCSGLTRFNFTDLPQLTSIDSGFLQGCSALTRLNFIDFPQLTSIDSGFLRRCSALTWLNFTDLPQLTSIELSFLERCSAITELDFTGLPQLTSIERFFLHQCYSLKTVRVIEDSVAHRMLAKHRDFELEFVAVPELMAPAG